MSTIEVRDEGTVRWIGLNRPDKRNAIDQAMSEEFGAALDDARRQPCVLIVHSTTPGIFAAGADIAELRDRDADAALLAINAGLFERLEAHRWPTIALVDGAALGGGCELALACDFRLATERAVFGQPELSLGILAGAGANWRLAQLAGLGTARRMLYTGARLTAEEALRAGLVDEVHLYLSPVLIGGGTNNRKPGGRIAPGVLGVGIEIRWRIAERAGERGGRGRGAGRGHRNWSANHQTNQHAHQPWQ